MANSIHLALLSFLFLAAVGSCSAFNVTQVLGPLRQFSTFSNYLAQVGVVGMMTNLKNVTILAVDNANMGSISGKSREEIKRAMTMHVIPEYYDLDRLRSLENGTALIRTIYVLTGLARGKDGMLLVTKRGKGGRISFASAILPRSKPSTVTLLRSVVVPSLNVSIFQVSGVIVSPPPVVSVASEGAGADSAGRIAVSSKLVARREFPAVNKAGDLNQVFMPKTLKPDGDEEKEEEDDIKTSEKAASKGDEESAPAKAPSKAPSKSPSKNASPPKKSPAKAPSPSKSSNSTSGGKKGKSTAPAPSPSSDSPAPAPSKKKKSDSPSPAPSKDAPSKSPAASKSPKAAKSSEPSPADSSSDDSPAPSKSSKGGSSSESPDSSSSPSPSDDYYAKSSPPAPAKGSESPSAESPSDEAEAPAEAPSGGASPMSVTNVGIMMTVMALWALAA
ncbi:unnamed protein product [Linum tenue]|uniref:FAS1 domain-containing protein n=1 Tax=Linum tenue TaxID=586396 RepID=A0AAV0KGM0_9ROSI|nr:unnamed protein product [Linum tenue]